MNTWEFGWAVLRALPVEFWVVFFVAWVVIVTDTVKKIHGKIANRAKEAHQATRPPIEGGGAEA